jgi:hypothetical protein
MEFGAGLSYSLPKNDAVITRMNPTPRFPAAQDFKGMMTAILPGSA